MDRVQGKANASGNAGASDAGEMLREQLRKQIKDNAENPQMKGKLEKMLSDLDP